MDDLELQLQKSLRRKQPPAGFSNRVLAAAKPRRRASVWSWIPAAAAATLLLGIAGTQYQEYRQGQRAKDQLMQALQITSSKLAVVERTLTNE